MFLHITAPTIKYGNSAFDYWSKHVPFDHYPLLLYFSLTLLFCRRLNGNHFLLNKTLADSHSIFICFSYLRTYLFPFTFTIPLLINKFANLCSLLPFLNSSYYLYSNSCTIFSYSNSFYFWKSKFELEI